MDVDSPWQVESIEAFYVFKCPECNFDAKEEIMFQNHAVENHPLSGILFGTPEVEMVNPEEILDLLIKTEPPENSFENKTFETLTEKTFETFAEDSNGQIDSVKAESYEPFFCKFCVENLNDMKMHLKIHEKAAFDLTNIFETEYFENLTTLNQGGITYANKPENIQSFIESGYGMPENYFEVKSESIETNKLDSFAKQGKCFHCGWKMHAKGEICPHNSIENSTTTNDKMNNITRSKKRDKKNEKNTEKNCEKKSENKTEKKCEKTRKKKTKKTPDNKKKLVCPKKKCGKLFENR
jgi:hypothetical protein